MNTEFNKLSDEIIDTKIKHAKLTTNECLATVEQTKKSIKIRNTWFDVFYW